MTNQITQAILEHNDLDGDWDEMIFTGVNPTTSDVNFNFFDALISLQTNVPNTPIGYVQPPILASSQSTAVPSVFTYPTVNVVDSYTVAAFNRSTNTMKYDSVHNRMYMTYQGTVGNCRLTWKDSVNDFFDISISLPFAQVIVDTAISTTSNKLIILDRFGRVFIVNTITNAIITTFLLPTAPDDHRQVEWNNVKNTWYVSCILASVVEISCVTNAVVALVPYPPLKRAWGLAFKSSTNEMFVTYQLSNEIAVINCTTNVISTIIPNTITTNPTVIFYNPTNDLITYGSNLGLGIRSFNATTLVFDPTVINQTITFIGNYALDNKLYLMPSSGNIITILDSNTLAIVNTVNTTIPTTSVGLFTQIEFYPPDNEMYYSVNVQSNPVNVGRIFLLPPTFYVTGSVEYNDTVRDFFNSPAWVRRIYFYSQTKENLYQVIQHIYKDANGNECNIPRIPSLSIGINQFQGWIAEINFEKDECVFGINQYFQDVLVKSGTELGMLLIYKQIEKVKLLGSKTGMLKKTICDEYASCTNKLRKWSEKDLKLNDYTVVTPFKQNMFKGQKEDAVKPFTMDMIRKYEIEDGCKKLCDS